jgi:AmmeMemoRadiSam system protein B
MKTRPSAVAGTFYPRTPMSLRAEVDALLDLARPAASAARSKAIVAPHAGYIYSGPTAASVFAGLADREGIKRVVLVGPAHRMYFRGIALAGVDAFETPLGPVKVDRVGSQALLDAGLAETRPEAHNGEHSLEVELPFIQRVFGEQVEVLPLLVGDMPAELLAQALELTWGGEETLVVVSSDMSHFLSYDAAQAKDQGTVEQVLAGDTTLTHEQACGATGWNALQMVAARKKLAPSLVDVRNSGDTAGDKQRVVGYAAFAYVPS